MVKVVQFGPGPVILQQAIINNSCSLSTLMSIVVMNLENVPRKGDPKA